MSVPEIELIIKASTIDGRRKGACIFCQVTDKYSHTTFDFPVKINLLTKSTSRMNLCLYTQPYISHLKLELFFGASFLLGHLCLHTQPYISHLKYLRSTSLRRPVLLHTTRYFPS